MQSEMNSRQLEIIQHCVGADKYGRRPHVDRGQRNHFCAGVQDEPICRELVEMGYMVQHETTRWLPYFNCSVTGDGINAMLRDSPAPPKLTRSQKRYQSYLSADCDMSFGEWMKCEREFAV